jgi:flagellar motor switch protein FliM
MSNALTDNLSREKIQQLLAAIGSEGTEESSQTEAAEYNWQEPHYFTTDELNELEAFTETTATEIGRKFAALFNSDFNVTIASTTQHFAAEFLSEAPDDKPDNYCLIFGVDQNQPFGFVSIPAQTAIIWAKRLLGDAKSEEDSESDLSQLEESLLTDLASAVVGALSDSYESWNFQPTGTIVKGQFPLEAAGTEELCRITFSAGEGDSDTGHEAHLLILCEKLQSVAGRTEQKTAVFSAEDMSKAILAHLQDMPVLVTARLASIVITFEEIASLGSGDILLLDKRIDKPIELIAEGRTLFGGRPAKSAGRYAVAITEKSCDTR